MPTPRLLSRTSSSTAPRIHRVQVDKAHHDVPATPPPTARRVLEAAGKRPVEQFALYQKPLGGQPSRVPLDAPVDLTHPESRRFITLPLDQTEG